MAHTILEQLSRLQHAQLVPENGTFTRGHHMLSWSTERTNGTNGCFLVLLMHPFRERKLFSDLDPRFRTTGENAGSNHVLFILSCNYPQMVVVCSGKVDLMAAMIY